MEVGGLRASAAARARLDVQVEVEVVLEARQAREAVGAAGEQIGEALRTSGLPSVDMHYTSNVISRACSCRDKTQAFVVGAKQFSMKLAMIALQHMVEDPEWHAHDA